MPIVTDQILDAAMVAYGVNKNVRADRERLRRAIKAAADAAYHDGYREGVKETEYDDSGTTAT